MRKNQQFLFVITALIILPVFASVFFSLPQADDFCFSYKVQEFGLWGAQVDWYTGWTGRFASSFIISLFSTTLPGHLINALVYLVMFLGFIWLLKNLALKALAVSQKEAFLAAFVILAVYFQGSLDIAQTNFWLSGTITYQLPILLMLYLIQLFVEPKQKYRYLISALLLPITIASNETLLPLPVCFIGLLLIGDLKAKNLNLKHLALLLYSLTLVLLVAKAPGNAVRSVALESDRNILAAIGLNFKSLLETYQWLLLRTIFLPGIAATIYCLPIVKDSIRSLSKTRILNLLGISLAGTYVMLLPAAYAMNGLSPKRALNTVLLWQIITMGPVLIYFLAESKLFTKRRVVIGFCALLTVYLLGMDSRKWRASYQDLLVGNTISNLSGYNRRLEIIERCEKGTKCVVPKINSEKTTTLFNDAESDPKNWKNACIARKFKFKEFVVE